MPPFFVGPCGDNGCADINPRYPMKRLLSLPLLMLMLVLAPVPWLAPMAVMAQGNVVYRCPGPPVLYTDALSADEARERGCRTIEGAPITIIQTARPRPPTGSTNGSANAAGGGAAASRPADSRVDPAAQRQRDGDARRILESELRREEERLAELKRDFNNGEPERRGDERNFQTYLDRVAQMRASLARSESDVAAIKRELGKLPP